MNAVPHDHAKIIFSFPVYISFIKKDESLLREYFQVKSFLFHQQPRRILFSFLLQFLFLLRHAFTAKAYVSFFAGYSSFLPALFAKLSGKPHLTILGGTDCCAFPSFQYGNFQKRTLGWFTCQSLKWSSHLLPVDQSLVKSLHTYTDADPKDQGYLSFCPSAHASYTVVPIGFDDRMFYFSGEKTPKSFLTVAQMNPQNYFRKGIDLVFEMAHRFPDCSFTLIGHNPDMKFEKLPPNITLIESVSYNQLRDHYSAHRFYLQLSIMEGFPSAPCDAMLCECVPIVSNVAALPHIAGETGFILNKKDPDLLEELIREALNSDLTERGKKARQRIISLFPVSVRMTLVNIIRSEIK